MLEDVEAIQEQFRAAEVERAMKIPRGLAWESGDARGDL
jgi:hypothetical protein